MDGEGEGLLALHFNQLPGCHQHLVVTMKTLTLLALAGLLCGCECGIQTKYCQQRRDTNTYSVVTDGHGNYAWKRGSYISAYPVKSKDEAWKSAMEMVDWHNQEHAKHSAQWKEAK
jgi:hypothetical protein